MTKDLFGETPRRPRHRTVHELHMYAVTWPADPADTMPATIVVANNDTGERAEYRLAERL